MDMKRIGKNMAVLRKTNGFTQEKLAEKLGVSPQAVSKWETGSGLPEASLLIELSRVYRVSVDEILQPDGRKGIAAFINRNMPAPAEKILNSLPRISRWNPPEGCDMYYSMPAMIAEALCGIEAQESGRPEPLQLADLNERFRELLHIMGVGYGFLWNEQQHLIEELWRINGLEDMADRAMRYYGRDYLWLTTANATPEEMRRIIVWSIDKGHPVVMEWAGGIPEFSIVTGYKDRGQTLVGYTYCEEGAAATNEQGMFVNPARWNEEFDFHVLIIGDSVPATYSDKDSIEYALEVLGRKEAVNTDIARMTAGDEACREWLRACGTTESTLKLFHVCDIFTHALYMNSIYTQKCILPYYKKLSISADRHINDIVIQMTIAINRLEGERHGLDSYKDDYERLAEACRQHIESVVKHREHMRGWLRGLLDIW